MVKPPSQSLSLNSLVEQIYTLNGYNLFTGFSKSKYQLAGTLQPQIYIIGFHLTLDVLWPSVMWSWLDPITAIVYWGKKQFTVPTNI